MAKKRKGGNKVETTNLITALINLIIALTMLVNTLLERGR